MQVTTEKKGVLTGCVPIDNLNSFDSLPGYRPGLKLDAMPICQMEQGYLVDWRRINSIRSLAGQIEGKEFETKKFNEDYVIIYRIA